MNLFSYPEAGADGTEEPSCGPTAPGERNLGEVLNKRVGVSGRGGRTSGLSQMFHLGWRAGRCTLAPSDRLVPGCLKLANERGAGNLELGTGVKEEGAIWRGFALIFDSSTDQRQLIGLFSLASSIFSYFGSAWESCGLFQTGWLEERWR